MPIFDVVVVGGGPSGEEASGRLADHGLSVALVEDRLVGGECVHWTCMPSEALLRPYEALAEARRDEALIPWVESHGITLVRGHGRIVDERRVMVGDEELEARHAVILSVDSQPLVPAIEGLGDLEPGRVWTNREATTTREIPRSLVVVGGGPEGVELAQAFQTLGSQVTLIEALHRVLPHAVEFASDQVTAALQEHGVEVLAGHSVVSFSQQRGRVALKTSAGSTAAGDVVVIAVGRRPTSEDLGIETVGLEPGALVAVDEHMRVPTAPWLYAVGDINGRALLTHMGRYAAGGRPHPRSGARDRPWRRRNTGAARDLHRSPGRERGPHLRDRHPRGDRVRHLRHGHLRHHAAQRRRLLLRPERAGHRPLHRRPRAAGPVGCTITGSEVVDFVHPATIAVVAKVPLERLRHAVPPFPTRSELWLSLLEQAGV